MLAGDMGEWNRFAANTATSMVPYSGAVSSLNRVVTPQLKDVQNDVREYVKNRYKFLSPNQEHLVDLLDVYTGKPIDYTDPFTALMNEVVPFFNTNTGEEDFRFKLIESGWKGMPSFQTNPFTGSEIHPEERYFINNWVAQNYPLRERVEELFDESTEKGKLAMQSLREYRKVRGQRTQKELPIKNIFLHDQLDSIHREAFDMGFNELRKSYEEFETIGTLRKAAKVASEQSDLLKADKLTSQAKAVEEGYLTRMRQDFKNRN